MSPTQVLSTHHGTAGKANATISNMCAEARVTEQINEQHEGAQY